MSVETDIQNAIASAQRQAEHEQRFRDHMHECMLRQEAANRATTVVWPQPKPYQAPMSYGGGGGGGTYDPIDWTPFIDVIKFPFVAVWFLGGLAWEYRKAVAITAAVVATPFLLSMAWSGFTGFLTNNITYVYGHRGTITLNGHMKPADRIASGELVDHGFWSPARHLLNIPAKFQLTKSAVITGNLKNIKLAGPGLIKIEGDVDNSTVLAGKGFVYIRGSIRNGSDVEGYDVKVLGTRSADSAITSWFDWKRNRVASR